MHFKAGSIKAKATIEIDGATYSVKAPLIYQSHKLAEKLEELNGKPFEQSKYMREFICELGTIPMEKLEMVETEMFNDLFDYIIQPKKK